VEKVADRPPPKPAFADKVVSGGAPLIWHANRSIIGNAFEVSFAQVQVAYYTSTVKD